MTAHLLSNTSYGCFVNTDSQPELFHQLSVGNACRNVPLLLSGRCWRWAAKLANQFMMYSNTAWLNHSRLLHRNAPLLLEWAVLEVAAGHHDEARRLFRRGGALRPLACSPMLNGCMKISTFVEEAQVRLLLARGGRELVGTMLWLAIEKTVEFSGC